MYVEDTNDSSEWTTIEPLDKITNKKLLNLHTESPISIYLKLKQIRKQLMANNTNANRMSDRHEDQSNASSDQNQDASNILKSHEANSGGFSPLTVLPVYNRSNSQSSKDKYLNIINSSFKNQNNQVVTVTPLPANHKLPLPTTSVHISSMDLAPWRPVQPLNHKSDLFSMFKSNRLSNSTQQNKLNAKNSTTTTLSTSNAQQSTTSKPKSSLKPINPSLPPKAYTPPTTSISQHIHRPPQINNNKNNFNNKNKHLGHPNGQSNLGQQTNNRIPMGLLNLRNDHPFGHRPSSSNNIPNTALPNGMMTNFNLKNLNNLNNNNWMLNRPQLDPSSPLFGQPLSDSSLDSMDQMFSGFNSFNNPLSTFDEIPSLLRREDTVSETTIAPPTFYRESRTNLKNNPKSQQPANSQPTNPFINKELDLETLLGLTEFESFKLNSSNANNKNAKLPAASSSTNQPNMNRFQKRIGIVDREFIDEEYYRPFSTRTPIDRTTTTVRPTIESSKMNEIHLDLSNLTSIEDRILIKDKLTDNDKANQTLTTFQPAAFKDDDLRLNNFNDDIDLTGELPKFNGDGLIEMTTTQLDDSSTKSIDFKTNSKSTTLSLSINTLITTTPIPNQIECDPFSEFRCANGKQCVSKTAVCDHEINCTDNSDEANCSCADYLSRFNQKRKLCDGILDCKDLTDELNCDYCRLPNSTTGSKNTADNVFICPNTKSCIRKDQVCNGDFDCPNGEDENFCVSLADEQNLLTDSLRSINEGSTVKTYQNQGILVIRRNGYWRPLCLENSDVVSSLFGTQSAASSYNSLNSRSSSADSSTTQQQTNLHAGELTRTNNKLFKGLSADTIQGENGDLIVANSNTATLSAYSLPGTSVNRNLASSSSLQPKLYPPSRPWFDDETSYNWQLDELGRAVCSIQSFNELDSINVTSLSSRGKQLAERTGDQLNYYSMNQQNIIFKNNNAKWANLFKADTCLSGKIASIRCKEFGK